MIPISVIIPVYNSEQYIKNCISSLQGQIFCDWEAILVDDGSEDCSLQICKEFAEADKRIKVVHQENQGVSAARNTGIKYATGKRVMFLDSDDALAAETFVELQNYMDEDYDVICWSMRTDNEIKPNCCSMSKELSVVKDPESLEMYDLRLRAFSGWSADGVKDSSMHLAVTKLMKRQMIIENNIWFDTSLKYHEDTLFTIQVLESAKSAVAIDRCYYIRTLHADSATVSFCNTISDGDVYFLEKLHGIISQRHPGDIKYDIAYAKFQLSTFLQCLKLDSMHIKAPYSIKERKCRIKSLLNNHSYMPQISVWQSGFKWTHRVLYLVMKWKLSWLLYVLLRKNFSHRR